jgi:hypothetical protein
MALCQSNMEIKMGRSIYLSIMDVTYRSKIESFTVDMLYVRLYFSFLLPHHLQLGS